MRIWPGGVLLVELPGETTACEELESIVRQFQNQDESDVVMDFENVTILTSRSLTPLMHLRDLLHSRGRRLFLCSLGQAAKGVFSVTRLDRIFEIVDDRSSAMAAMQARPDRRPAECMGDSLDRDG